MSEHLEARLSVLQGRVQTLERAVDRLQAIVAPLEVPPRPLGVAPKSQPSPVPRQPPPAPQPTGRASSPAPRREPGPVEPARPRIELADLLGARSLAITGGVVTLLGILFFFVLAVERGWIGPGARVALGAAASTLVFLAGIELRRRYGDSHSSLAAVAAGIAGGFGTLLAAAVLYSLVPDAVALVVAAGIAVVATATALAWRSELVAGLGLVGAALVPVGAAQDGGLTAFGTSFAALVYAGAGVVAVRRRWPGLVTACTVVTVPQIAALVASEGSAGSARVVAVATAFSLLYVGAGIAWHVGSSRRLPGTVARSLLTLGAWVATGSAFRLFGSPTRGFAALVVALFFAALAYAYFGRRKTRDLSAFLGAIGLTVGALAVAELLSGQPLAYAWAAEAAVLAWLARRLHEPRYQVFALGYLVLSLVHVLAIDSPLTLLFRRNDAPAHGAGAVAALTVATVVFALYARSAEWESIPGRLAPLYETLRRNERIVRAFAFWASGVFAAYTSALLVVELGVTVGGTRAGFDWGHVGVSAAWAGAGLAILFAGLGRRSIQVRTGGLAWLAVAAVEVVRFDARVLATVPWSSAFLIVAGVAVAAALADELLTVRAPGDPWVWPAVALLGLSIALSVVAVFELAPAGAARGTGLLGLTAVYGALSAALFRQDERDFTTLLWGTALVLAAVAAYELVAGTYLVLAWAALAAVISWLGSRIPEPRLQIGAAAGAALALGHALVLEAPPSDLFAAGSNPATGAPALILVVVAITYLAKNLRGLTPVDRRIRVAPWWVAGLLGVYLVSLSILELAEQTFGGNTETAFQRGHSAVSAFWGLLGLALLYTGLTRLRALRISGFVLFGLTLAKIFLYDLRELSSVTRALSFLAVGAVLLMGGFFYQRLAEQTRQA
jgi:uncharacterized membrane protein